MFFQSSPLICYFPFVCFVFKDVTYVHGEIFFLAAVSAVIVFGDAEVSEKDELACNGGNEQ